MKFIKFIVQLLVVIGALNWGLWGFFQYDAIQDFLGTDTSMLARTIYGIIGIAGIWAFTFFFCPSFWGCRKTCCHEHKKDNE